MADDIRAEFEAEKATFERQAVEGLAGLEPSKLPALALFERLEKGPLTTAELIALQPEIELALLELEEMADEARRMVERCLKLEPTAARTVPPGF